MGPANSTPNATVTPPAEATEEYAACIDTLSKNGYYKEARRGLHLYSESVNGAAAIGGFGEGFIGHGDRTVFSKANSNSEGFGVAVTSVMYIRGWGGDMPTPLPPLLGSPSYDKGMNGYVYAGILPTDHTLRVTLSNRTPTMVVSIPATSPITADESTDTTLTSRHESGHIQLRITPCRAFLEHIFLIKAPPTINKFHLSAVPSPTRRSNLTPASKTSIPPAAPQQTRPPGTPRPSAPWSAVWHSAIMAYIVIERRRVRSKCPGSRLAAPFGPSFEPSSFSPPTLYYEAGERPRTRSLATSMSLSDFKKEVGVFIP
ncbi:hypothetical protein HOY80DRAFT_1063253 [Tuber brumale]|nr:hypothetical protein HOY80DRAFT_1063253 [Tuber brumale]